MFRLEIAGIHLRGGGEFDDGRNPNAYRCMDYMSSNRARCPYSVHLSEAGAVFTLITNVPIALWLAGLSSRPDFDSYKLRRKS